MTHLEQSSRADIDRIQDERLAALVDAVIPANPFWTRRFEAAGLSAADVRTRDDLQKLPLTEKADLVADQEQHAPYGSNLTFPVTAYSRMHQTSGTTTGLPMRWLDTPESWGWLLDCWSQIYRMVGLRADDRLAFPFSFGPFIGFWGGFDGAGRLGNLCLAGGGMSSQGRLKLIQDNAATVVLCTPTYALRLAEVAEQENINLADSTVRALVVAGEPGGSIPATRERIETAWGARLFDHWGMSEIGALAVECVEKPAGLHMLESECICEILDSQTHEPVAAGEVGELVITNLGRHGSPLFRYRTGDLVKADQQPCACGRELLRLDGGILGRADDMVTIRGNNVFPSTIESVLRRFPEIAEFRIVVVTRRSMPHLRIEIEPTSGIAAAPEPLVARVQQTMKERLNFTAEVVPVPADSLPRFELKGRRFFREESG